VLAGNFTTLLWKKLFFELEQDVGIPPKMQRAVPRSGDRLRDQIARSLFAKKNGQLRREPSHDASLQCLGQGMLPMTAQIASWSFSVGESSLLRYLKEIQRFPMLEPQDEYMLAKRWSEHGDREVADKLVTSHLRLVAKIAMGYRGYGLPISEVISEGNVGLMQAVKRFRPEKGFRLTTYAMWWIKAAIQEYILRSWPLVKMGTTANQKKLFFNLRKAKNKISALEDGDLRPEQVKLIANRLGVTEQDVVDMNRRLSGDVSLNATIRRDGDSGEWQDWLIDETANQETQFADSEETDKRLQALHDALTVLTPRERRVFEARDLTDDPVTLAELASEYGVSRERVRQIEANAFDKVQRRVRIRPTERVAHLGRDADTYLPAFRLRMPAARSLTSPPHRIPLRPTARSPVRGIV
jgi:RNA polymerase sigma-32 factor